MSSKILTANYTLDGIQLTGLHPIVNIFLLDQSNPSSNTHIVTDAATSEIGSGWYRYDFIGYDISQNYVFSFDAGVGVPPFVRFQHGANDVNSADVWEEPILNHLSVGTLGYSVTQTKADTTNIITTSLPAISTAINNVPSNVRSELAPELAHILTLQNGSGGLTQGQATMLLELYEVFGLDPTKPLIVDMTMPSSGTRTAGSSVHQDINVNGCITTVTRL